MDYTAAYALYERCGNLAEVARNTGLNENSLRDYARRHDWKGDREKALQEQQALAERLSGTIGRVVAELESKPSIQNAQRVREIAKLAPLVGGVTSEAESAAQSYAGGKDEYRALLLAALKDAVRAGKQNLVGQYMDLLGKLDGHVKGSAGAVPGTVPLPDFGALRQLGGA